MDKYKTKREAETAFKKILKAFTSKQCPVFQKQCLGEDCHSFQKGRVKEFYKGHPEKYYIANTNCGSPLVTGIIDYDGLD